MFGLEKYYNRQVYFIGKIYLWQKCIKSGREEERTAKLSIHKQCHIPDVYFVSITETDRVVVANFLV